MRNRKTNLKDFTAKASAWSVLLPALTIWPFVSAFPAFSIISDASDIYKLLVQGAFFATGFWALGPLAAIVSWVRLPPAPGTPGARNGRTATIAGVYSLIWTAAYAIAVWRGWA